MYTYSIFSVKAKVAMHYFYKTGILFRFLTEYKEKPNYQYLQLQYNYVMEPLHLTMLVDYFKKLPINFKMEQEENKIKIIWRDKSITIYENNRHLEVLCESIEDVEEFFFPALRQAPHYYFVVCEQMKDYGWLSVKRQDKINNQLLYSFH